MQQQVLQKEVQRLKNENEKLVINDKKKPIMVEEEV